MGWTADWRILNGVRDLSGISGLSKLIDGFIIPPTHLELNVVDHCNIACRACNHASPIMPAWFADPDTVFRDYAILARHYRPAFIKVLGGEPLMHRHLDRVIGAARATGIGDHFTLTTNGTLLDRMSDAVWEAIDELEVSVYPGVAGIEDNLRQTRDKARALGKKLTVFYYDQFRATFNLQGTTDRDLVGKVYAACKIANLWGCHTVREGYFYKCPQSIYAALLAGRPPEPDGIAIVDGTDFQTDLLAYVNATVPLTACANCVGTVGVQESHALMPRKQWRSHINLTMEEAVDYDWLEHSLITLDRCDDCKIPAGIKPAGFLDRLPWLRHAMSHFQLPSVQPTGIRLGRRVLRQPVEAIRADSGRPSDAEPGSEERK
ncbi:MAG: radical SAM protein [Gallionellaceae bacterium]|nr:radical SAM protein [Gallionellaceae bacterium]